MNNRLLQFLAAENINQSQFADSIGVARASISHIIAGRNKPGYDFIENTMKRYPALSIEWLLTGKGKMYKGAEIDVDPSLFPPFSEPISAPSGSDDVTEAPEAVKARRVSKIIVLYDDDSYQVLSDL